MEKEINKGIVINILDKSCYIPWIETLVESVLEKSGVGYQEIIIEGMEGSKRIFLTVDGVEYTIRIWDVSATKIDQNNRPCAARIEYTLFKQVEGDVGNYSIDIFEDYEEIEWDN